MRKKKVGGAGGVAENGPPLRAGLSLVQYLSSSLRFNPSYTQTASPISPPPPPWCHSQPACSNTHRLAAFIQLGSISKYFPAAFLHFEHFVVVVVLFSAFAATRVFWSDLELQDHRPVVTHGL